VGRPALPRRLVLIVFAALAFAGSVAAADSPVATVTQTLSGLDDIASGGFEPPDVQVAAGRGYVMEMVNLAARTWRTNNGTAVEVQTQDLAAFFGSGSDRLTDPRIIYDAVSERWFASISDVDGKSILVAVSTGGDPTGSWTVSAYPAPGCADQPRLGLADGTVVLAADIFLSCVEGGSRTIGAELWVVNKQELLAGSKQPDFTTYGPDPTFSSFAPVQSLSPTSTEYVVSVDAPRSTVVHLFAVDGIPPAAVTVKEVATPSINRMSRPPFAAQPPAASGRAQQPLDTNDARILESVWEGGRLWLSGNTACIPAGDSLIRSCARIVELSTATRTVTTDTDLSQRGAHLFYPAIRPDGSGDLVVVYGESGLSVQPEVVAVGRRPDGTFTNPVVVAQSTAYLGDRYGDYFGAARDPANPALVWVAGEVGTDVAGGRGWATTIASVVVTAPGAPLPQVIDPVPPPMRAVHTTGRAGKSVRLVFRSLGDAAAMRSVVTVRSKGKVVFTSTTAKAALHAGQLYFVLWRPAKKLRGTLPYCVYSISPSGAPSPPSCSTVTLR
jgi:cell wall-associated NlpC family hydrolase